jgi:hypothetical protein
MLRLDSTTTKLQAVLGGAVASLQPQAAVCFSDQTATGYGGSSGKQLTLLNSTTDVDILAAPAASTLRDVDFLSIYNRDSASVTVTVKFDVSGTDSTIITATLLTLETLEYTHGSGWKVLTSTGAIKVPVANAPAGASGDVQYNAGAAFGAEAAFNYDAVNNILAVDNIRLGIDGGIRFDEHTSAPATPASGNVITYSKQNGRAYGKDDTGQEFEMFASQRAADGRLTLTSATPVLTANVTASTSIFYALYLGNQIALYDGTVWTNFEFSELTNTTTDATKNPASVANNSNYDLFVWNDAGTLRLGRGPAWTSDTARGTGAGTTELERVNGALVNKIAITNGPAAQRGRYVGTVRSNGTATIDWIISSAQDVAQFIGVWNMYNRVLVAATAKEGTNSWTYASTTWRSANADNANRISAIFGLNEDAVDVKNIQFVQLSCTGAAVQGLVGIGLDSTSAPAFGVNAGGYIDTVTATIIGAGIASYAGLAGLGFHFFQAIEAAASGTITFYGDAGGTNIQTGISLIGRF